MQSAGTTTHPSSRYGAPEALTGVLPDFDGRLSDWSAVAFEVEAPAFEYAPVEDWFLRAGVVALVAAPWVYIGGVARALVWG